MNDPYLCLGVALDASDATIRSAYLEGIRRHPPDRAPERFAALRSAYEKIANEKARRQFRLLNATPPTRADVLAALLRESQPAPLGHAVLKELLLGKRS